MEYGEFMAKMAEEGFEDGDLVQVLVGTQWHNVTGVRELSFHDIEGESVIAAIDVERA